MQATNLGMSEFYCFNFNQIPVSSETDNLVGNYYESSSSSTSSSSNSESYESTPTSYDKFMTPSDLDGEDIYRPQ